MRGRRTGDKCDGFPRGRRIVFILTLMMFALVSLIIIFDSASGDTWIVDDNGGSWADYTNVHVALEQASSGDTIRVYSGHYTGSLSVEKEIYIIGNGSSRTTLEGSEDSSIIEIVSDNVFISGIGIQWFEEDGYYCGFRIYGFDNITLIDCSITGSATYGLNIRESTDILVINCTASSLYGSDITLIDSVNITVRNFTAYNNSKNGLLAGTYGRNVNHLTIEDSNFTDNGQFLEFDRITNLTIIDSELSEGIEFSGYDEHFLTADFFNCTVKGLPFVHLKDTNDMTIDYPVGEIFLVNTSNISVRNIEITDGSHGVYVSNSDNVMFDNITIENMTRTAIFIRCGEAIEFINSKVAFCDGGEISMWNVNHSRVRDCIFDIVSSNGLSVNGNNITVDRCRFKTHWSLIDDNYWGALDQMGGYNFTVINCTFIECGIDINTINKGEARSLVIANSSVNGNPIVLIKDSTNITIASDPGQVILVNCSNSTLRDLEISNTDVGIILSNSKNMSIVNCTVDNSVNGIECSFSVGNTVQDCHFHNNSKYGIRFHEYSNNVVTDCIVEFNGYTGCWCNIGESNIINNSTFRNNTFIGIKAGDEHIIRNCSVSGSMIGIDLLQSSILIDCKVFENSEAGVDARGPNSTIDGLYVHNNSQYGILLHHSHSIEVSNCTIAYNGEFGIYLEGDPRTTIHHNNFIDNGNGTFSQAFCEYNNSEWDDGNEGNYWSDYNGSDTNHDGIGDTPYETDGYWEGEDRYPLMEPNGSRRYPRTWIVDDDNGSWADFDNIQDAIDRSKDNWTIKVYSGIYEGNLSINSKLTIIGNSSGFCEIIGSGQGSAVVIGHDNVTIMGFSISGGGSDNWDAGIDTNDHQGTIIRNCRVHDNDQRGILISSGSENTIIQNCLMSYNIGHGITILGNNNSVIGCNSSYNDGDGIRIWDGYHNVIRNCQIHNNADDYYGAGDNYHVQAGLSIIIGGWNIVRDSAICNNFMKGVYILDSLSDLVDNCYVQSNSNHNGIKIYKQEYGPARFRKMRISITNSTFETDIIRVGSLVNYCQIHHNNFHFNNSIEPCQDIGRNNSWDDGFEGNYWSDYEGIDLNNDGIGDSPYSISGKSNSTDRYPLMEPNGSRKSRTWIVDDNNGSWADFDDIQDAIDASLPGDTIWLFNGSYQLEDDLLQIGITIQGNGSDTRLSGAGTIKVLTLGIRDTTIRDLTIVGDPSASTFTGISAILIRDSFIERCWFEDGAGIYIWSAWNLTLRSCHFTSAGITYADFDLLNLTSHTIENCTLDGRPIVFRKNDQNLRFDEEVGQLILVNCEDIEIDGLSFSNRSADVFILYCTNVTVNNISIERCYGGFYFLSCEDVRIQNCYFTRTVYSIFIRLTVNITITYNIFIDLIEYPIRIDGCEDIEIVDNKFKGNDFPIKIKETEDLIFSNNTGPHISINVTHSNDIAINGSEFRGNDGGIEIEDSNNVWITNSTFDNTTIGIDATESNYIFILYCNIYFSNDISIDLELCMNVTIRYVVIREAGNLGIKIYQSYRVLIDSNIISGCDDWAIYIGWRANKSQILNNSITNGNRPIGVCGDDNRVMYNEITNNSQNGFHLSGDRNEISYNKIEGNDGIGIEIWEGNKNVIHHNLIENNGDVAFRLAGGEDNVFHHNLISKNGDRIRQATDRLSQNNTWHDGSEGNYWSDYNGTDDDNNGIGDTPYYLLYSYRGVQWMIGEVADYYPLMNPDMINWQSYQEIKISSEVTTEGYLVNGEVITVTIELGSHSGIPHESNISVRLKVLLDDDELNEYVHNLTLSPGYSKYTIERNVTLSGTGEFTFKTEILHDGIEIDSDTTTITSDPRDYTFSLIMDRLTSSADPGDRVQYTLTIENRGNVPQFLRLSCESDWISITNGTLYVLPDSEKTSKVYATVPSNANGTINFTILAESVSNNDILNSGKAKVEITVGDDDGSDPERIVWVFIGASFAMVATGFAGLWGTDRGRYFAIPLLIPLYSKLKKEAMTDHETRGRIVLYLNENPGAHFNRIKKELDLKNGTTGYHLRVLEGGGFIKSRADGMYRRFYPYGYKVPDVVLGDTEKSIVMQIIKRPGIKQRELASKLKFSQSTVAYHIKDLKAKGIVSSERRWGCNITEEYRKVLRTGTKAKRPRTKRPA